MEGTKLTDMLSRIALELGIAVLLALIFAFLGVYDSDAMPWGFRFLFWFVLMAAGALALSMAEPLVMKRLLPNRPLPAQIALTSLLISVPLTLGLVGLNTNLTWQYSLSNWGLQFMAVTIIAIFIVAGRAFIRLLLERSISEATNEVEDPTSAFRERLPIKYREADLWAVSSEGHYLRVHTSKGEAMILFRLVDAIKELKSVDGLQTHRSWWVARDGISEVISTGGKTMLKLKSGVGAPVSRARMRDVKEAGWT